MSAEPDRDDTGYDDQYEEYEPEECEHEDYDITWEGRCECARCSYSWWATAEQIKAQARLEYEYAEWEVRQHRRDVVWWRRTIVGFAAYLLVVYGPRFCCDPDTKFGNWCLANSGDWVYRVERGA